MTGFQLIERIDDPLPSPARQDPPSGREPIRVGAVQCAWNPDPEAHRTTLAEGIRIAAGRGAEVICLQELTLAPYFAIVPDDQQAAGAYAEEVGDGPTTDFARRMAAETGAVVQASLYEADPDGPGFNTAIAIGPDGAVLARTRKIHIPQFPLYHEDRYFAPGDTGYPVIDLGKAKFGFPTCWDQWNPELARIYSLEGAEVLVYPTAIGMDPIELDYDTQPMWRHGIEGPTTFYGSSFISDPYGRVVVEAPRDEPAVLVADLDLDQRRDWMTFGMMETRRPDQYRRLVED
jgi:N-carbamoylputrescine amidase